ncbi:hypothetical protein [Deinococcus aquaticus]|uniref:hypothetical protein n=1 Tax=Deinococcus aquaticus TaxID=328692 RepID=UPI003616526C
MLAPEFEVLVRVGFADLVLRDHEEVGAGGLIVRVLDEAPGVGGEVRDELVGADLLGPEGAHHAGRHAPLGPDQEHLHVRDRLAQEVQAVAGVAGRGPSGREVKARDVRARQQGGQGCGTDHGRPF